MEQTTISIYSFFSTVFALITIATGFFLLKRDFKRPSTIFFFLASLASGLWAMTTVRYVREITAATPDAFDNLLPDFFASTIALMFLLFVITFTTRRIRVSNTAITALFLPYLVSSSLLFLFPSYFIVNGPGGNMSVVPWSSYVPLLLFNAGYVLTGLYLLVKRYQSSAGVFKTIMRSMVLATSFGVCVVIATTILIYFFYNSELAGLLRGLAIFASFVFVGFKILQYYRWNTRPFVAELCVSFVACILFVQMFLATSAFDSMINIVVLILFAISGYFLVRSIERESRAKDEIEELVKDLREVNAQLKVLDKKKSEFVKISSHHLKSPLTLIKGYASMILEGSFDKNINAGAREAIQKIFDASERLVGIIQDFMDISNIESGKMEYEFADVDLKRLIASVLEEMKITIEKSGLDTSFNTDEIGGYTILADAGKLRQVISNLLDNSIKYTPKGKVHLFLKKDKENKKLHLTITDTGVGMSKETIEKLFEKFSRADDANKVNTGGSGLGLYVAKEIMKRHDARIWVESPGEGNGSTFHLEFEAR